MAASARSLGRPAGDPTPVASSRVIDLHTHSTVSDGSDPPEQILGARRRGRAARAVALTDHDSLAGIGAGPAPGRRARASTFVPGCEVSCRSVGPGGMHVLVYFVERRRRPARRRAGPPPGGPPAPQPGPGRPDGRSSACPSPTTRWWRRPAARGRRAAPLRRRPGRVGAAGSIDDAFDRYLANGRPGYVPKARLTAVRGGRPGPGLGRRGRPGPPLQPGAGAAPTWPGRWASWPRPASAASRPSTAATRPVSAPSWPPGPPIRPGGHRRLRPPRRRSSPTSRGHRPGDLKVPDRVLDQLEAAPAA